MTKGVFLLRYILQTLSDGAGFPLSREDFDRGIKLATLDFLAAEPKTSEARNFAYDLASDRCNHESIRQGAIDFLDMLAKKHIDATLTKSSEKPETPTEERPPGDLSA